VSSSRDRGSVVVADLAVGAAIVIILSSAASAAGIVIDSAQSAREAARSAAVELARGHGPASALRRASHLAPHGADIDYEFADGSAVVRVHAETELPHPVSGRVRVPLSIEVSVPIAPYRSW